MMSGCRNSLFNMNKLYSKNTNGIEIFLICSALNNYVGLNTFISFYCQFIANFVTILLKSDGFE